MINALSVATAGLVNPPSKPIVSSVTVQNKVVATAKVTDRVVATIKVGAKP